MEPLDELYVEFVLDMPLQILYAWEWVTPTNATGITV